MNEKSSNQFGAVILAAGASSRMGQPKLLLPWGGVSVLAHVITIWKALETTQVGVVVDPGREEILAELRRIQFPEANQIPNALPDRGMFSSIQCAARWSGWSEAITHWVVVLGDQPQIPFEILSRLLENSGKSPEAIWQPSVRGKARHPVVLPKRFFDQLAHSKAPTLKAFLEMAPAEKSMFETGDEKVAFDIDRPEEYEFALKQYGPKSGG